MSNLIVIENGLISDIDDQLINEFVKNLVLSFYDELDQYLTITEDFNVVEYATERAFLSMSMNGYCRLFGKKNNIESIPEFALIQEYTIKLANGKPGRPDCFIIIKDIKRKIGIWIESKFNGFVRNKITDAHWDKEMWKKWNQDISTQARNYFEGELQITEGNILSLYESLFVITLSYKLIKEKVDDHLKLAYDRLNVKNCNKEEIKNWFYSVGFLDNGNCDQSNDSVGIEVFGSVEKVSENGNRIL